MSRKCASSSPNSAFQQLSSLTTASSSKAGDLQNSLSRITDNETMLFQLPTRLLDRLLSRIWNLFAGLFQKRIKQGIILGFAVRDGRITQKKVLLADARRPEHIAILGKTGVGKSYFLRSLIKQDI